MCVHIQAIKLFASTIPSKIRHVKEYLKRMIDLLTGVTG